MSANNPAPGDIFRCGGPVLVIMDEGILKNVRLIDFSIGALMGDAITGGFAPDEYIGTIKDIAEKLYEIEN